MTTFESFWYPPRTSAADGRNSNEIFILPTDIRNDALGISKIMKISLPNLNDMDFRSTEKKVEGSGITTSYFPALMKMVIFGHFSQYRAKG